MANGKNGDLVARYEEHHRDLDLLAQQITMNSTKSSTPTIMDVALIRPKVATNSSDKTTYETTTGPPAVSKTEQSTISTSRIEREIAKQVERLMLFQQWVQLEKLENSLEVKKGKLDALEIKCIIATKILDDLNAKQSEATKTLGLEEVKWRKKDDTHQQLFQRAHKSRRPIDFINAATAEAEALKLKPALLELGVEIWKFELLSEAKDMENKYLRGQAENIKAVIAKLEGRVSSLKVRMDRAWIEWEWKWSPQKEVADEEDTVSLDGDEEYDNNHTLGTTMVGTLEAKEGEIEDLKSQLKVAALRCVELADESKMHRDTIESMKQKQEGLPEESMASMKSLEKQLHDALDMVQAECDLIVSKQVTQAEMTLNKAKQIAEEDADKAKSQIASLQHQIQNLEEDIKSEKKLHAESKLTLSKQTSLAEIELNHAKLFSEDEAKETKSQIIELQHRIQTLKAEIESEKRVHEETKSKIIYEAKEKFKEIKRQAEEKAAKRDVSEGEHMAQIATLQHEIKSQKMLLAETRVKLGNETKKKKDKFEQLKRQAKEKAEKERLEKKAGTNLAALQKLGQEYEDLVEAQKKNLKDSERWIKAQGMTAGVAETLKSIRELAVVGAAIRSRELEYTLSSENPDQEIIVRGNKASYGGEVLADALLYTTKTSELLELGRREDKWTFFGHYGVFPEVVLANRSSSKLLAMLNFKYVVTWFNTPANVEEGSELADWIAKFQELFDKLLTKFLPQGGQKVEQCLELSELGDSLYDKMEHYYEGIAEGTPISSVWNNRS